MTLIALSRSLPTVAAPRALTVQDKTLQFMARVESWYNLTVDHTATHGLDTPNRFSISKLLRTPQLYSLPGNKYKGWSTCNDLIESINARIELFNQSVRTAQGEVIGGVGQLAVVAGLSNLGTRKTNRGRAHAWDEWREKEPKRKLHLDMPRQAKALRMVVKYLQTNTPNAPSQYHVVNNNLNDNNNNFSDVVIE